MSIQRPAQALLVIDMQADYFADGELQQRRLELVEACNEAARRAHEAGVPVVEIRTIHAPDRTSWTLNMLEDGQGLTIEGTDGVAPVDGLDLAAEIVVEKTRDSAFHRTSLGAMLRDASISSFALGGVSTESCIATTAADAYARDIQVTLVGEALASTDPEAHRHALDRLTTQYRQPVQSVTELIFARSTGDD